MNYVAKGGSLYKPGETTSGADSVVRRFLSLDYLWNQVRVQGGAYGSSASSNPISGSFVFSSYRDPNLKKTLDTYDGAATYLKDLKVDDAELTKAIVAAIGDLDSPLNPDQKGMASLRHYLQGTTLEQRKKWRSQVLEASPPTSSASATGWRLWTRLPPSSRLRLVSTTRIRRGRRWRRRSFLG